MNGDLILLYSFLTIFGMAGICLVSSAIYRLIYGIPQIRYHDPIEPVRAVILVEGSPAINVSNRTIEIVPYRNNTITNHVLLDNEFIVPIGPEEPNIYPVVTAIMM